MDWYPFYPRRYRRSTRHLCPYQDGLYRRLIDEYMDTEEELPDNDSALARICGISLSEFTQHSEIVRAFFTAKNGKLFHEFCENQLDVQDKRKIRRTDKASKGAKIMHQNRKLKQMDNILKQEPSRSQALLNPATGQDTTEQKKVRKKERSLVLFAENRFQEFWNAYPRQRRGSKSKTESAYRRASTLDTEENIHAGLQAYRTSREVADGYAKGAAPWLADERWRTDYSIIPQRNSDGEYRIADVAKNAHQFLSGRDPNDFGLPNAGNSGDVIDGESVRLSDNEAVCTLPKA